MVSTAMAGPLEPHQMASRGHGTVSLLAIPPLGHSHTSFLIPIVTKQSPEEGTGQEET